MDAYDADEGANALLRFELSGQAAHFFRIENNTGVIKAATSLTNNQQQYTVTVSVRDSPTAQPVVIMLNFYLKAPQHFPVFKSRGAAHNYRITENQKGVMVATVLASSPKPSPVNRISYGIVGGNTGSAFKINSFSGQLTATEKLDHELQPEYELWVSATDGDNPPLSSCMPMLVRVDDQNDNLPRFSKPIYSATIRENELPLTRLLQVTATDADSGDNSLITYSILDGKDAEFGLKIDPNTGVIKTTVGLDREKQETIRFTVEAKDGGSPTFSAAAVVVVTVLDENDHAPKFTRLFKTELSEDSIIGDFVIQVTASDADDGRNSNNTFYLSANPGQKFKIDPYSGNVTVNGQLDREVVDSYQLKVMAIDGSWRIETSLTVDITDINDNAPIFTQSSYQFNISELQPSLSTVGTVSAIDKDADGPFSKVSYRLSEKSTYFKMDANTGRLLTLKPLYYVLNGSNEFNLVVVAEDAGSPPMKSEAALQVSINPRNSHSPICLDPSAVVALTFNTPIGSAVYQVQATDDDIGINSALTYQIAEQTGVDLFKLDETTGWLTTNRIFDRIGDSHLLKVLVKDSGAPSRSTNCSVIVKIVDTNNFAPEFPKGLYQLTISENEPVGNAVDKLEARDFDEGLNGKLTYKIIGTEKFIIDENTGMLLLKEKLDFEQQRMHNFSVVAQDQGMPKRSATVQLSITVKDENDNKPRFNSSYFEINVAENSKNVARVIASDQDGPPHNVIHYSLSASDSNLFQINNKTGELSVKTGMTIDYEQKKVHMVKVQAANLDVTGFVDEAEIHIIVTSENEYWPIMEKSVYNFVIPETSPKEYIVGTVLASDKDGGKDGIIYYFIADIKVTNLFGVNSQTGAIFLQQTLQSARKEYKFEVYAKNRLSENKNQMDKSVVVIRLNNEVAAQKPFVQDEYSVELLENSAPGTTVLQLGEANTNYEYEIVGGNNENKFAISSENSVVQVVGFIDRETTDRFHLKVQAQRKTGTLVNDYLNKADVHILVTDVNDNAPFLEENNKIGWIRENDPAYTNIMALKPKDLDSSVNRGPFTFRLVDSTASNNFEIDQTTGVIRSRVSFNREVQEMYRLTVELSDAGRPPMKREQLVEIFVDDVNDSPPSDTPVDIVVVADLYQLKTPLLLGSISAADLDTIGSYKCLSFSQIPSYITVKDNCNMFLNSVDKTDKLELELNGSDGVYPSVNYTVTTQFRWLSNDTLNNAVQVRMASKSNATVIELMKVLPSATLLLNKKDHATQADLLLSIQGQTRSETASLISKLNFPAVLKVTEELCTRNTCQNKGVCRVITKVFPDTGMQSVKHFDRSFVFADVRRWAECECPVTFGGERCEKLVDHCQSNPCHNGGLCSLSAAAHQAIQCRCAPGFTGEYCQTDIDECSDSKLCQNGAHCQNSPGSYSCICLVGFGGKHCQNKVNFCKSSPCKK